MILYQHSCAMFHPKHVLYLTPWLQAKKATLELKNDNKVLKILNIK